MKDQEVYGIKGMILTLIGYIFSMITLSDAAMIMTMIVGATATAVNVQKFIHNRKKNKDGNS